jgi:hypothetical protein
MNAIKNIMKNCGSKRKKRSRSVFIVALYWNMGSSIGNFVIEIA